jgi:hypothetical protein
MPPPWITFTFLYLANQAKKKLTEDVHSGSAFWNIIFFFRMIRYSIKNLHWVILPNTA